MNKLVLALGLAIELLKKGVGYLQSFLALTEV